eukprot:366155-Chlamydomonas_euryale.AAC.10
MARRCGLSVLFAGLRALLLIHCGVCKASGTKASCLETGQWHRYCKESNLRFWARKLQSNTEPCGAVVCVGSLLHTRFAVPRSILVGLVSGGQPLSAKRASHRAVPGYGSLRGRWRKGGEGV